MNIKVEEFEWGSNYTELKVFEYHQNNAHGYYTIDDNVGHYVIIQASSPEHADMIAEQIGIDFSSGCPCCGDRWDKQVYYENSYSTFDITEHSKRDYFDDKTIIYLYLLNGLKMQYTITKDN